MWILLLCLLIGASAQTVKDESDVDGESSRKILGSSVVTSVSVIMDTGNGSKAIFSDAVGKPVSKPMTGSEVASPIDLLNPDRYEFYTFDDSGDLVKRLMTLDEIQGIVATGDSDGFHLDTLSPQDYTPEKRVNDIVNNVQNVLKEEMEIHKDTIDAKPPFDTPDVSDSWSMILPAIFGNSGEDIKPEKPVAYVTPDTIMIEPSAPTEKPTSSAVYIASEKPTTPERPISSLRPISSSRPSSSQRPISSERPVSSEIPITSEKPISSQRPFQSSTIINNILYTTFKSTTVRPTLGSSTHTYSSTTYGARPSSKITPVIQSTTEQMSTKNKLQTLKPFITTEKIPNVSTSNKNMSVLNVQIYSNSQSTTEIPKSQINSNLQNVKVKPVLDMTKDNRPIYHVSNRPSTIRSPTFTTSSTPSIKKTTSNPTTPFEDKEYFSVTSPTTNSYYMSSKSDFTKFTSTQNSVTPLLIETSSTKLPSYTTSTKLTSIYEPSTTIASSLYTTTKIPLIQTSKISNPISISTYRPKITSNTPTTTLNPVTTSTEPSVSTEILQNSLPTLVELLHMNQQTSETEQTSTNKAVPKPNETVDESTSEGVTYTMISNSNHESTTLYNKNYELTNQPPLLNQLTEISQDESETYSDDLSTLASEYLVPKNNYTKTTTENIPTTVPIVYYTTISTSDNTKKNKITANEILDQLLLTTTNIYEINTELSQDSPDVITTTEEEEVTTAQSKTELPTDSSTNAFVINLSETTQPSSKDDTLIASIEQLLSQAVGNIENAVENEKNKVQVETMLENSAKKNMSDVLAETATIASNLMNSETITTEENILNDIASADTSLLSNSVGSLLSQVYGIDNPSFTTLDGPASTEKYTTNAQITTVLTNRKTDNVPLIFNLKSTESTPIDLTTRTIQEITDKPQEIDVITTESSKDISTTPEAIVTTEEYEPHIINITIISSDKSPKPAKVDLSQEQYYIEEDSKNITDKYELLNADATSLGLEQSNSTSQLTNSDFKNETYKLDQTTTSDNLNIETTTVQSTTSPTTTYETTTNKVSSKDTENVQTTEATTTENSHINPLIIITINETKDTATDEKQEFLHNPTTEFTTTVINKNDNENVNTDGNTNIETKFAETQSPEINTEDNGESSTYESEPVSTTKFTTTDFTTESPISSTRNIILQANTESVQTVQTVQYETPQTTLRTLPSKTTNSPQNSNETVDNKHTWTLVPTIAPHTVLDVNKNESTTHPITTIIEPPTPVDLVPKPLQGFGLEDSTANLDTDIYQFAQLCNELAFGFWKSVTSGISTARSVFVSPFAASSLLAMVFLGARGATSGEMNEILKLDDMVTFNPHLIFKNVTESVEVTQDADVAVSTIVRELYSDRSKGKLLGFYKERARQFYDGHVEEVSFKEIGDVIRRRTNLLVKKQSSGKITEFLKDSSITVRSPLAGVSVNIFQTDCSKASTEGRDGELHFVVLPSIRQRRLIPIPAVVYKSGFLAGYEPSLDATAVALGTKDQVVSTILIIPGQQGIAAPGDGLARLEKRLVESSFKKGAWSRLLRALIPRPGLEVQIPRFSHRSVVNATFALKKMGLKDLFDPFKADLRGLNGVAHELHFSEMIQINNFATCGEDRIGDTHHSEIYPATASSSRNSRYIAEFEGDYIFEEPRDYQRAFHDPLHDPSYLSLPLPLRPRQARIPEVPRLRFDRPFLYLIRHNPTGLILHMGRFNPRLLP